MAPTWRTHFQGNLRCFGGGVASDSDGAVSAVSDALVAVSSTPVFKHPSEPQRIKPRGLAPYGEWTAASPARIDPASASMRASGCSPASVTTATYLANASRASTRRPSWARPSASRYQSRS